MKFIHLFEMPQRFDHPGTVPASDVPYNAPVATQFLKFIQRVGEDRVHANRFAQPWEVEHFTIAGIKYGVLSSDDDLMRDMKRWEAYDQVHPMLTTRSPTDLSYEASQTGRRWKAAELWISSDPEAIPSLCC